MVRENIDILICCGEKAKYIAEAAQEQGMPKEKIFYLQKQEIISTLQKIVQKNDIILVKASNAMKFYELEKEIRMKLQN